jgi:hypothetical protein
MSFQDIYLSPFNLAKMPFGQEFQQIWSPLSRLKKINLVFPANTHGNKQVSTGLVGGIKMS